MQNQLQIFNNPEFGEIRTVMIDNEPWLVGKDVAVALGYERAADAIRQHVDADDKGVGEIQTPGGKQNMTLINESGLYALIFGSKLENAKKFKKWVTSEVLPSIRKNGSYHMTNPLENLSVELQAVIAVDKRVTQVAQQVSTVKKELEDFKMDMPILGIEIDKITEAVHVRGVNALGGKNTNAYKDKSLRSKVYQDIYRELKRQFGVVTYKAIKRSQCEKAIAVIDEYELPLVLQEEIREVND